MTNEHERWKHRRIITAEDISTLNEGSHCCRSDFDPLRRLSNCNCKCGRHYTKDNVCIISMGRNSSTCVCEVMKTRGLKP